MAEFFFQYYIGYAATQILIQIVVADLTTLRWRTIVQALTSFPYFINFAAGALIADSVLEHSTWHWGCKCCLLFSASDER